MERILSHQHDTAIGSFLEQLLEAAGLSHEWTEFFIHFLTDTVNLLFILFTVMFAVSLLQTYIPFEKLKGRLARLSSLWGYLLALLLGVASPFCSCTVIPVVMGIVAMGVPVSVALCYLTSAALLSIGSVIAFFSTMGANFGILYTVLAVLVVLISSLALRPLARPEDVISYSISHDHGHDHSHNHSHAHGQCSHDHDHSQCGEGCYDASSATSRLGYCFQNVGHVFRQTWLYMIFSILLSSAVISFVPLELLHSVIGPQNIFSPLIAGLIAAPLHVDAFTALPMLQVLQPINPSAAIAFVMGGLVISVPEVVLLSRVFRPRTIVLYAGLVTGLAIIAGYAAMFF